MVNPSVQEGEAPKQHTQHGGEGRVPHRAEAFVAMKSSEERCQAGPLQVQPDTQREGPARVRIAAASPVVWNLWLCFSALMHPFFPFFPSNASKAFARSLHKLQLAGN